MLIVACILVFLFALCCVVSGPVGPWNGSKYMLISYLIAGFILAAFLGFGIYSICVKGETLAG